MNIFFFHGKLSNPQTSQSAKACKEYFEALGHNFYIPDYQPNYYNQFEIDEMLTHYIHEIKTIYEETVFIGISLGGYWALKMANRFPSNGICILLNPSLSFYKTPIVPREGLPLTVILNMGDEIISSEATISQLQNRADIIVYPGGDHRMTNIKEILPEIDKAINREAI